MEHSAICIAGMHRSGTSLLTRMLANCGLYLGPESWLMKPAPSNPEGFFEHLAFVTLNARLLAAFNGHWDRPPRLEPDWVCDHRLNQLREEAEQHISAFGPQGQWGWKDPRNSLTFPFWRTIVPSMKLVVAVRSPVEVAASLKTRSGFSLERGLSLWLAYHLSILSQCGKTPILFTHYDMFSRRPKQELSRILDFAGIRANETSLDCASQLPRETLQHHRYVDCEQQLVPSMRNVVLTTYRWVQSQCGLTHDAHRLQLGAVRFCMPNLEDYNEAAASAP